MTTTTTYTNRFCTFLILLLMGAQGLAQPARYFFEHLTTRDGLSQNDVNCIIQDDAGFMWFGTNDGLNRYDGYEFTTYRPKVRDSASLISNLIQVLAKDQLGRIWIGTAGEGVSCFLPRYNRFVNLQELNDAQLDLKSGFILDIHVDTHNRLWIGTTKGLDVFQLNSEYIISRRSVRKVTDMLLPPHVLDIRIEDIHEDPKQDIWIGSVPSIFKLTPREGDTPMYRLKNFLLGVNVNSICSNEAGMIMVATAAGIMVAQEDSVGETYFVSISKDYQDYLLYHEGVLWSTSSLGLSRFMIDDSTGLPVFANVYQTDLEDPHSLSKTVLRTIYADRNGILWIGTNGGGVNKFEPEQKTFFHYRKTIGKGAISYDKIRSFYEDSYQNLWVGTEGGGINFLPAQSANQMDYKHFSSLSTPSYVFAITEYQQHGKKYLMIGGQNVPSLYRMELTPGMQSLDQKKLEEVPKVSGSVFALHNQDDRFIWVGTYNLGLYRFDLQNPDSIAHFVHNEVEASSLPSNLIRSLMEDKNGNLWIGTGKGLSMVSASELNKANPIFINYTHEPDDLESISHDYILALFQSSKGDVWVGTFGGGLAQYVPPANGKKAHFITYTEEDGLPNNVVKGILEDEQGHLWISTNRGLSRFNPLTGKFSNFDTRDGLQSEEFSELACFKMKNGNMIFGGVNGFNVFKPSSVHINPNPPQLAFTEFQVLNKQVGVGETFKGRVLLEQSLLETQDIFLAHNENSFSLGFSAFHYRAPIKNKYAYKLEGLHEDWVYVDSDKRFANFTNLDPGTYTFLVKAGNSDGIWNSSPISINIHVAYPLWMSWWAFVMYGLVILGLVWLLAHYTLIGVREKHHLMLEHMERKKNEELQQMKLRFFTNISHEFRTPLSLISAPMDFLIKSGQQLNYGQREKQYLLIRKNVEYLLRLINQLLDFRKIDQEIVKLRVQQQDIVSYIRDISEPFEFIADNRKVDFRLYPEQDTIQAWFDSEIVEKTLYNLLSNAFKYTPSGGTIEVFVNQKTINKEKQIEIRVHDSGRGIPKSKREKVFERFYKGNEHDDVNPSGMGIGLSYTRELVKMHKGKVWVEDNKPQGAAFVVILPQCAKSYDKSEKVASTPSIKQAASIASKGADPTAALLLQVESISQKDDKPVPQATNEEDKSVMLIVDDNESIRTFLRQAFSANYHIIEAEDGITAWELAIAHSPDLILSDVMMPRRNGIELCQQLKEDRRTSHIPIILLTAKTSEEAELEGIRNGADAYVCKPFKLEILEYKIQNILRSREELQTRFRREVILKPKEVTVTSTDELFLQKAVSIIEENMTDPEFNVEALTKEIAMSRSKLYQKLKALTGQTSSEFIRSVRLKRAVQLLESSDLTVKEAMFMTGFNTASYFSKCFKRQYGMVPSEYIKQKRLMVEKVS